MNRVAYYNRLQNAEICLERFDIFIPIQTSDQKLILEPNRSKGLSVGKIFQTYRLPIVLSILANYNENYYNHHQMSSGVISLNVGSQMDPMWC